MISICWHPLLPDSSTLCRRRSLEPVGVDHRMHRYLKGIVDIFSMVSLCSYGRCISSGMSFVACFPTNFSDISGLAITQCYQDEAGPLFYTVGACC